MQCQTCTRDKGTRGETINSKKKNKWKDKWRTQNRRGVNTHTF